MVGQILKSDPNNVPALMVVATTSEQKSDANAAQRAYERILAQYPDFTPALRSLTLLYSSNPAYDQKVTVLAAKARQAFPADPDLARALGLVAYRQADFTKAVMFLQETAAQKGRDGELMYYLGMAQWHLNKRSEGKVSLQRALELGVNDILAAEAKKSLASFN
jgi:uncharacterized protein HemY